MLICKAYNGRVVMQWLAETVAELSEQDGAADADDRIAPVALCMILATSHMACKFHSCSNIVLLLCRLVPSPFDFISVKLILYHTKLLKFGVCCLMSLGVMEGFHCTMLKNPAPTPLGAQAQHLRLHLSRMVLAIEKAGRFLNLVSGKLQYVMNENYSLAIY